MSEESTRALVRRIPAAAALVARAAPATLTGYVLITLAAGAAPVLTAWLMKLVLDQLVNGAGTGTLLWLTLGLAATGTLVATVPQLLQYLRAQLDRRAGLRAQDQLFGAVDEYVGLARFEDPRFLDRLRLAQQTVDVSLGDVVDGCLGVSQATLTIGGFVGSLLLLSPLMTGLVLAAGAPTVLAELVLSRRRARMYWRIGPAQRREIFYGRLLSTVDAAKEVRLFGTGRFLRGRMLADRRTANDERQSQDRLHALVQTGLALLAAVVAGIGLVWAGQAARHGRLTVGDIAIFVAAVAGTQAALASLATDLARAHYALLMFGHYSAVVHAGPDLPVPVAARPVPPLRQGIELRDVWFRYADDHPWVLRGVSLTIPRGSALALVGRNGSGKSTLVKLLCRFYDPDRGSIRWDGVDLRDLDPAALRARIGAVFQDYVEYDLTAAENIALSDVGGLDDRDRIRAAAAEAGVDRTVEALPRGYDTLLSRSFSQDADPDEVGVALSGGQWQRLALARALFRGARELTILDEPSAGLDAEAEAEVHRTVRRRGGNGTCLLISHRLSAVRHADVVAVLADGRITELGDHVSLVAAAGDYAHLFALQAEGYQAAP